MDSSESKNKIIPSKLQNERSKSYSDISKSFLVTNPWETDEDYRQSIDLFTNVDDANESSQERVERKLDELRKSIDLFTNVDDANESSQERLERNLDELRKEVATKEDINKQTQTLLIHQELNNKELLNNLEVLRSLQASNVPYKKLAKNSFVFLTFFAVSFLAYLIFDVVIVTPFWTNIGLIFSFLFLLMSFAMKIDWLELIKK